MRSRYAAFAVGDSAWLLASWHPATRPAELRLDRQQRWVGLQVGATTGGGLFDEHGTVTFTADFARGRRRGRLEEHSAFSRDEGRWSYVGPVLSA